MESTGRFRTRDPAALHLKAGARKVLVSAPGKDVDVTVVLGVNDGDYDPVRHDVLSNASCTTNCVAPMGKVLHEAFGIERGLMTTIHAYTNDQVTLDSPHKDLRRGPHRGGQHHPDDHGRGPGRRAGDAALAGKLDGLAVRVPVEDGSLTDLTVLLDREVTVDEVNEAFAAAATAPLAGILRYSDRAARLPRHHRRPGLVRLRLRRSPRPSGRLVKVFGWYDNEWGYSTRLVDLAELVGDKL